MKDILQFRRHHFLKSALSILLLLLCASAAAPEYRVAYILKSEPVNTFSRLIDAIVYVESSGDTMAFNPIELAVGAFQIRPIRLLDYNLRTGKKYQIKDCYSYKISKEIFLYYAIIPVYPDYEKIARDWNGSGVKTIEYWEKVRNRLLKMI